MKSLNIIKIGGNIIDDGHALSSFIQLFLQLEEPCILVHGGGKLATALGKQLGIEPEMVDGRRITYAKTLDIITMVYAGLINKKIVAMLQGVNRNAIGLSGADANIILAEKRIHPEIDFGFVGDVSPEKVQVSVLNGFLEKGLFPVIAPLTHDGKGQLLNTNADSIAGVLAIALSAIYDVRLVYCFEKNGVMTDINDDTSVIPLIDKQTYAGLKKNGAVSDGMIPKLDNAFNAIEKGVKEIYIGHALKLNALKTGTFGTKLVN